ncbi:hypothetical protein SDC9_92439 [bioreactor metagenome]|uniref:Uncharacterized protein n=1 Tax=bioreactor metagenome TaxID=1076179 RepID=A0A644ZYC0_9ZZZZ
MFPIFSFDHDLPFANNRIVVLGDLETFWEVRVEVVLPVELSLFRNLSFKGKSHFNCCFHGFFIQDWK